MKRPTLLLLALGALAFPAWSLDYAAALERATALDPAAADLARAEAQALTTWRIAVLGRDQPKVALKTGDVTATWSTAEEGPRWSAQARPAATVTTAPGWALSLEAPLTAADEVVTVSPEVGGRIPLLSAAGTGWAATEAAQALDRARPARQDRALEVERTLVEKVRALLQAQVASYRAGRSRAKAAADWQRSQTVDGARPGGTVYAALERADRLAARDLRVAEATVRQHRAELALLAGLDPAEELTLSALPPGLEGPLAPADQALAVVRAQADLRFAEAKEGATEPSPTLGARWGLGWGQSTGTTARTGLEASFDDWQVDAGFTWSALGAPSVSLSLGWTPPVAGVRTLEAAGRAVGLEGLVAAVDLARSRADRARTELESRRVDLAQAATDRDRDLADAQAQLALYRTWQEKGMGTATDLAEVESAVIEARGDVGLAVLDWWTWDLDRRALWGSDKGE